MNGTVETLQIPHSDALDPITVYWHNYEPGKGMVTMVCWGCAWNAYFGSTGEETIQDFFRKAGASYLVNKMLGYEWQKDTKKHQKYLGRLINAVKAALENK